MEGLLAQRNDNTRCCNNHFAKQVKLNASLDFMISRRTIVCGIALDQISDPEIRTINPGSRNPFIKKLATRTNKGPAYLILCSARIAADYHVLSIRRLKRNWRLAFQVSVTGFTTNYGFRKGLNRGCYQSGLSVFTVPSGKMIKRRILALRARRTVDQVPLRSCSEYSLGVAKRTLE